jgi:hypothetical protein
MTREQAVDDVVIHFEFRINTQEALCDHDQRLDVAIQQLKEGNAEPAVELLEEEWDHLNHIACGEYDDPEDGEEGNRRKKESAREDINRISEWFSALM